MSDTGREAPRRRLAAAGLTAVVLASVLAVWHSGHGPELTAQGSATEASVGVDHQPLLTEASSAPDPTDDRAPPARLTSEPGRLAAADDLRAAATRYLATEPADRARLEAALQRALVRLEEIRAERNRLVDQVFDLLTERDRLLESDPERAAALWKAAEEANAKIVPLCMEGAGFGALLFEYGAEPALRDVIADYRNDVDQRPGLVEAAERFLAGDISARDAAAAINPMYVRFKAGADACTEVGKCAFRLGDALLGKWGIEQMANPNAAAAEVYLAEALEYFPDDTETAMVYHLALLDLAKEGQVAAVDKALKFHERYEDKRVATPMPAIDYNEACFWFVVMQNGLAAPSVSTVDRGIALVHRALDGADAEYRLHLVEAVQQDPDLAGLRQLIERGHPSAVALKKRLDGIRDAGKE